MQRERVTDDIYIFTSDQYVQVTAGVVITTAGAVVIDTLLYPDETRAIKRFVEERLGTKIKYVVNTHFHADHTTGTCFFDGAEVVSHVRCRELLDIRGRDSLERTKSASIEMRDVELVLPTMVFDDSLTMYIGNKTLKFWSTPGHSPDSIVCLIKEDQVLFAADTLMPLPYFVDGSYESFLQSLRSLHNSGFENIVQGHGEVVLRGEVEGKIQEDIDYLLCLKAEVDKALMSEAPDEALAQIDIESCGKSRILLNGAVQQLHQQNVAALANQRRQEMQLQP